MYGVSKHYSEPDYCTKKQTKSLFIFKVNNNKAPGSIWQLTDRPWPSHRVSSRLPATLSQEPQHRSRGLKRADFRGSVRTGRTPRSQQSLTTDQKRETMATGGNSAARRSEYEAGV